jgi:Na+/H+ antiporter NhaD/arsenite permease-like protein
MNVPGEAAPGGVEVAGVPLEFLLFGLTLLGVALFHHRTLEVALAGLVAIVAYKLAASGFHGVPGLAGLAQHLRLEWVVLANLFGLLMGFALLSRHFEESAVPRRLPDYLPDDWRGCFVLLVMVFVLSSFLDNIAAALIGGTVARTVLRERVHLGYIAALVAASNAGGSGSVVGDTTTTMMWIDGVAAGDVLHAYVAAGVALVVFGIPASLQQHRYAPIARAAAAGVRIDGARLAIVAFILLAAILVNVTTNLRFPGLAERFPFLGVAVWAALLLAAPLRQPDWAVLPATLRGTIFLLALVLCASLMPVERLPPASWHTTLGLGFVSAVFDNIPLTKLALTQGGYDWGMLAYAVGFGGSMIWFGSSAGVAITNLFPEGRSVGGWLKAGWHVALAYVLGFAALLLTLGWQPHGP